MAEGDEDFEKARIAFRRAADATSIQAMRAHAAAGMRFLERADALSAIIEVHPGRSKSARQDRS